MKKRKTATISTGTIRGARRKPTVLNTNVNHERDYSALLDGVKASFSTAVGQGPLFQTSAKDLFKLYLEKLPAERQHHNCHACRQFIERFGGLVTIASDGSLHPAMWMSQYAPEFYKRAFDAMANRVKRSMVTGPFLTDEKVWGTPITGNWTHLSVKPPLGIVRVGSHRLTCEQAIAAKREDAKNVAQALNGWNGRHISDAARLMRSGVLERSERFITPIDWLLKLKNSLTGRTAVQAENLIWLATAQAPDGFCHPRSGVVGELIDAVAAGRSEASIRASWAKMLDPLAYQRPQAAPKASNIAQAEKAFDEMGLALSLERRFATIRDVEMKWSPGATSHVPSRKREAGLFTHLGPTDRSAPLMNSGATMTWEKFRRTVMPRAVSIDLQVPSPGAFIALTTAVHRSAPPIMKWDDGSNPLAWYVYAKGSPAAQWGLRSGSWSPVIGITDLPPMAGSSPKPHLGEGDVLILSGCADTHDAGNALFPECLRNDLHPFRQTIEAYSKGAKMVRPGFSPLACGYDMRNPNANCTLRVFADGGWTTYKIDRWD